MLICATILHRTQGLSTASAPRPKPSGPPCHARTGSRPRLILPPHRHDQHWATFTSEARRRVGVAQPEDSIALRPWRPRLAATEACEKRDAGRKPPVSSECQVMGRKIE